MLGTVYISGLASGLDTDAIIQQLMDIERIPLSRLKTRQNEYTREKNAWYDLNLRLSTLWNKLTALKLASTFTTLKATSSNTEVLAATVSSGAVPATYDITIIQLAKPETVASSAQVSTADNVALNLPAGRLYINLNDGTLQQRYIEVNSTSTLQSIVEAINATPPAGGGAGAGDLVTASIVDHKLVIASKTTGSGISITFSDDQGGAITDQLYLTTPVEIQTGQDAQFTINGLVVTRKKNTVDDVITGLTLELKNVTSSTVTLQISWDTERAVDAIKAFVDQYNSALDFIASKLGDRGELQGDPTLILIQEKLRELATGRVEGVAGPYKSLQDIGINTGEVVGSGVLSFDRTGKLSINMAKLTEALQANPEAVYELFYNSGGSNGLAVSFDRYLSLLVGNTSGTITSKGILKVKEEAVQNIIQDLDKQIARMEDLLAMKEEQLRRQFTAMEKALSLLQAQGAWLSSQIMGLMSYSSALRK